MAQKDTPNALRLGSFFNQRATAGPTGLLAPVNADHPLSSSHNHPRMRKHFRGRITYKWQTKMPPRLMALSHAASHSWKFLGSKFNSLASQLRQIIPLHNSSLVWSAEWYFDRYSTVRTPTLYEFHKHIFKSPGMSGPFHVKTLKGFKVKCEFNTSTIQSWTDPNSLSRAAKMTGQVP